MSDKLPLIIDGDEHDRGDPTCAACWNWYPKSCECRGLIHASFIEESNDDVILADECDRCGSTSSE